MNPNVPTDSMPVPSGEKEFAKQGNNPNLSPGEMQKKKIIKAAVIGIVAMVGFIIVLVVILSVIPKNTKKTDTDSSFVITPRPSVDPASTSQLGPERVFIQRSTALNTPYDLRMTVPTAWDARFSNAPSKSYPWETSLLIQAMLSKYSPLSSSNINVQSGNYWAMMDVSTWLTNDKNAVPLTPAQKQAWFVSLQSVTPESYQSVAASVPNPRMASEAGGRQHIEALSVAGNTFRGISYLTLPNTTSYTPMIVTMMTANLDGKSIAIYSVHNVRDSNWAKVNELRERSDPQTNAQTAAAVNDFKAGKLGDDTVLIHDEHIRAISTMTLNKI